MEFINKELHVGQVIKEIREKKKFSQEYLAIKTNYSQNAISLIENNRRPVRVEDLAKFANALEVFVIELFPDDLILKNKLDLDKQEVNTNLNPAIVNTVFIRVIDSMQTTIASQNQKIEFLENKIHQQFLELTKLTEEKLIIIKK